MSTVPIRRRRLLGLPVWVLPTLIAVVLATAWMALAADDEPTTDVVEAGASNTAVPVVPEGDLGLPGDPPPGMPLATAPDAPISASAPLPASDATQAAIAAGTAAGTAAGAAAGAAAGRAVLASVGDVSRTIRESPAAGALNGRAVQIPGARVSEVLSDRAFAVGTGADRVLVLAEPTGGDLPGVRVGQEVSVSGSLETVTSAPGASAIPGVGRSGYIVVARPGAVVR